MDVVATFYVVSICHERTRGLVMSAPLVLKERDVRDNIVKIRNRHKGISASF